MTRASIAYGCTHLLTRADGDAHAAVAAGIVGAIADEDFGDAHVTDEFRVLRTDLDQHEVGMTGPPADSFSVEGDFEISAGCKNFARVPLEIGCVFDCRGETGQGERVHTVGREDAANPVHQLDWTSQ